MKGPDDPGSWRCYKLAFAVKHGVGSSAKSKATDLWFSELQFGSGFVLSLRFLPWPWVFRLLFPNADHLLWWFKHIPMGLFGFTNNVLQNPGQEGHTPISRVNTWEEGGRRMQGQTGRHQPSFNFFLSKEVRHYRYLKWIQINMNLC